MKINNNNLKINVPILVLVVLISMISTTVFNVVREQRHNISNIAEKAKNISYIFDYSDPEIMNIAVSEITENSANISWETNELTKSKINMYSNSVDMPWEESFNRISFSHWINELPSLLPGTQYNFVINSIDKKGNQTFSELISFTTLPVKEKIEIKEITKKQEQDSGWLNDYDNECVGFDYDDCIRRCKSDVCVECIALGEICSTIWETRMDIIVNARDSYNDSFDFYDRLDYEMDYSDYSPANSFEVSDYELMENYDALDQYGLY